MPSIQLITHYGLLAFVLIFMDQSSECTIYPSKFGGQFGDTIFNVVAQGPMKWGLGNFCNLSQG